MTPKLIGRVLARAQAVVLVFAWLAPPAHALEREVLTIATTPAGTLFFSIGGGLAHAARGACAPPLTPLIRFREK